MKKLFSLAILTLVLMSINSANAQLGFGAGFCETIQMTVPTGTYASVDKSPKFQYYQGGFVGANYNMKLFDGFGMLVGLKGRFLNGINAFSLAASQLGEMSVKDDSEGDIPSGMVNITQETSITQILVDVPVLFNFGFFLFNRKCKISLFFGVTPSLGLYGESKVRTANQTVSSDMYSGDAAESRFNLGGTIGNCINYKGFRFFWGVNVGLLRISTPISINLNMDAFAGLGVVL